MSRLFEKDISDFLDALRDEVKSQVKNGALEENPKRPSRSWWINDKDTKEYEPYVHIRAQDAAQNANLVTQGVLQVEVYTDDAPAPYRQRLAAMLPELTFPTTCKTTGRVGYKLLTLTVTFGREDDPVRIAAEPVLFLLTALYDASQTLREKTSD
jgi:hypothetical protein